MKLINNYSIRSKVTIIVMATTCVSLMLALLLIGIMDSYRFRGQMLQDAISTAKLIANNSAAAVSMGDEKAANGVLSSLSSDSDVGAIFILKEDGKTFAEYRRPGWADDYTSISMDEQVICSWYRIQTAQPIVSDGKQSGTVVLQWDTREIYRRLWSGATIAMVILLGAAAVGCLRWAGGAGWRWRLRCRWRRQQGAGRDEA